MRNRRNKGSDASGTSHSEWNEGGSTYGRSYPDRRYAGDRSNFDYGSEGHVGYGGYGTSVGGGLYENYGYDRNYNDRGSYTENQFSRESGLNRGRYQGDRDEGYADYNDWRYSQGSSGDYGRDYLNLGSERGANDRARDEYDRSNYEGRNYNRGGGNFGGGNYGSDYLRNRRDYRGDGRGWWDKASDEVSSWFGDEDAERRRDWDRQQSGQHKGKGPKGYSRSDERIKEDINDRLSDDVFVDATEIEVTVNQGEVTLTGMVNQRAEKRRAEDIVEAISGVKNVENRLRVSSLQRGSDTLSSTDINTSRSKVKQTS
jgi:osmotically-inducible protein OsmY